MMKRAVGAALLAALTALTALTPGRPALALAPEQTGWWWQPNYGLAPVAVPPPPFVPAGGLYIAADPGGARAVAALRMRVPTAGRVGTLALRVNRSFGAAAVRACLNNGSWTSAEGGDWNARPTTDCSATVVGELSADGSRLLFEDVTGLVRDGLLDVSFVPDDTTPPPPFGIALDRPDDATLAAHNDKTTTPDVTDPSSSTDSVTISTDSVTVIPTEDAPSALHAAPPGGPVDVGEQPPVAGAIAALSGGAGDLAVRTASIFALTMIAAGAWVDGRRGRLSVPAATDDLGGAAGVGRFRSRRHANAEPPRI